MNKVTRSNSGYLLLLGALIMLTVSMGGRPGRSAEGVVFDDQDGNGLRGAREPGIPGVAVSNGREIAVTDGEGRYRLPVSEDCIVFLIKPGGWRLPVDRDNLPRFYYIHKPAGSPEQEYAGVAPTGPLPDSIDFPLVTEVEPDSFQVVLFGDSQTENIREIDFFARDIVEEVIGTDAAFGITLGDIVNDDMSLYDQINGVVGRIGIPWYNVIGNHDQNYDSPDDRFADESYEGTYGPHYYSFNYGQVHFLVLDDIIWNGPATEGWRGGNYVPGLGVDQIAFIEGDLDLVPADHLVVVLMHVPLVSDEWIPEDREALFRLLEKRPYCFSVAAHNHIQKHLFLGVEDGWQGEEPHHHFVSATTCGSWWEGALDEMGIPHATMRDGAPNGWSTLSFQDHDYSIEFKGARQPAGHQMNIHAPDVISGADAAGTEVLVNVFAGSEKNLVEFRLGDAGPWTSMERVDRVDPFFVAVKSAEEGLETVGGRGLPDAEPSTHLWRGVLSEALSPGAILVHARTTDMFGQKYAGQRVIRVE